MAKRAKASEPSEPEHEAGIVRVDDPLLDEPAVVDEKPEAPPTTSVVPMGVSKDLPIDEPPSVPPNPLARATSDDLEICRVGP